MEIHALLAWNTMAVQHAKTQYQSNAKHVFLTNILMKSMTIFIAMIVMSQDAQFAHRSWNILDIIVINAYQPTSEKIAKTVLNANIHVIHVVIQLLHVHHVLMDSIWREQNVFHAEQIAFSAILQKIAPFAIQLITH